ncbi:MAG: hypothetical protein KA297_12400 [Kofleriaceae bacterium]|jgi:hypothetical protein|nr:hypothetical protein [Kofleriaceae bacterium]
MRATLQILGPVLLGAASAAAGCGGDRGRAAREAQPFECNDRVAGYIAKNTLGAQEVGVVADCGEVGPRLRRWTVRTDGVRAEHNRGLTPGEFDALWTKVDGSGWRYLEDCASGAADNEPTYTFTFRDWNGDNAFDCRGVALPFPYDSIRSELDLAASQGQADLDPDEPPGPAPTGGKGRR